MRTAPVAMFTGFSVYALLYQETGRERRLRS